MEETRSRFFSNTTVSAQLQSTPVFVNPPTCGQLSETIDGVGEEAEERIVVKSNHILP